MAETNSIQVDEYWGQGVWSDEVWDIRFNQLTFVNIIKDFPIILDKSMIPDVKRKKAKAIKEIRQRVEDDVGVSMSEPQVWKKIQNMKARIKKKSELMRTSKKRKKLKDWEQELLKFIESDSKNPSNTNTIDPDDESDEETERNLDQAALFCIETPREEETTCLPETEETKNLSLPELQRLVLLQQLQYYRKAEALVNLQLRKETRDVREESGGAT